MWHATVPNSLSSSVCSFLRVTRPPAVRHYWPNKLWLDYVKSGVTEPCCSSWGATRGRSDRQSQGCFSAILEDDAPRNRITDMFIPSAGPIGGRMLQRATITPSSLPSPPQPFTPNPPNVIITWEKAPQFLLIAVSGFDPSLHLPK